MPTKVLICKKIEDEPAYCRDRYELLQISRPYKNSHCFQKVAQLFNIIQDYFPIRDFKILEYVKKCFFKDTHSEKAPSNKTSALRKSTNKGVWAIGTLNQLFIRGS